jgi:hypothetical protein
LKKIFNNNQAKKIQENFLKSATEKCQSMTDQNNQITDPNGIANDGIRPLNARPKTPLEPLKRPGQ